MLCPFVHTHMPKLPSGRTLIDADFVLEEAGLALGARYADFGCGSSGSFFSSAAHLVGDKGRVYAVDLSRFVLAAAQSRCRHETLNNVETLWGDIERPGGVMIPDGTLDMVSLVGMGSVLLHGPSSLKEAFRVLRADGKLLVIDWKKGGASFGPDSEKRIAADDVRRMADASGFRLLKSFEAGPHHWALLFQK